MGQHFLKTNRAEVRNTLHNFFIIKWSLIIRFINLVS